MTLQELFNDIPRIMAYIICIGCLVQLFIIFFGERRDIIKGLKGQDNMWQFLELSSIMWLAIFPAVVICSLLGVEVPTGTWSSLDAVYFMNLGGKISHKWLDNKKIEQDKNSKSKGSTDEGL